MSEIKDKKPEVVQDAEVIKDKETGEEKAVVIKEEEQHEVRHRRKQKWYVSAWKWTKHHAKPIVGVVIGGALLAGAAIVAGLGNANEDEDEFEDDYFEDDDGNGNPLDIPTE